MIEKMGAGLATAAKTQAIATAFSLILGSYPIVTYKGEMGVVSFTPDQAAKLREYITAKMNDNTPSDLQIDLLPALLPLLLEKSLPVVAGILLLGYILGRRHRK
jgi:hypothetical protein